MLAAFVVYYCMYACRKPYAAATWEGSFFGTTIDLKTALAVSQILGYTLAKLIGTRVCSSLAYNRILFALLGCIVCALVSLLGLPYFGEYKFLAMFLNGLSLGMVWGFVMRPLEGRQLTEMLIAGLCVSFIIASGDVKAMGKWLIGTDFYAVRFGLEFHHFGVGDGLMVDRLTGHSDESWMPFLVGAMYFPFLVLGSIVLFALPKPDETDQTLRNERSVMTRADRFQFLRHHMALLIPLVITYFLLTAYRDFRDTFQPEILLSFGIDEASVLKTTERYIAFGVVAILSIFVVIKQSRLALQVCHAVMALGLIFCGVATWLLKIDVLDGYWWMVLAGLGAYVCYIAFHCIVFERMLAYTRAPGNASFPMMIFDFVGYVAPVIFMLGADFFKKLSHLDVLIALTWVLMIVGAGAMLVSALMIPRLGVFPDTREPQVG